MNGLFLLCSLGSDAKAGSQAGQEPPGVVTLTRWGAAAKYVETRTQARHAGGTTAKNVGTL